MDLDTASADDLDRIGDMWGLKRGVTESDKDFQHRIRIFALGDTDIGAPFEFNEIPDTSPQAVPQKMQPRKCECGAAALGHTQTGQGHSSWCPLR
jgi:hypothetical protein